MIPSCSVQNFKTIELPRNKLWADRISRALSLTYAISCIATAPWLWSPGPRDKCRLATVDNPVDGTPGHLSGIVRHVFSRYKPMWIITDDVHELPVSVQDIHSMKSEMTDDISIRSILCHIMWCNILTIRLANVCLTVDKDCTLLGYSRMFSN